MRLFTQLCGVAAGFIYASLFYYGKEIAADSTWPLHAALMAAAILMGLPGIVAGPAPDEAR
jgi:hypothetical protein